METQPTLVCRAALWGVQFPRWILGSTETFNKVKESDGEKRRGSRSVPSVVMFVFYFISIFVPESPRVVACL